MRISDWSSDVCSSDLLPAIGPLDAGADLSRRSFDPFPACRTIARCSVDALAARTANPGECRHLARRADRVVGQYAPAGATRRPVFSWWRLLGGRADGLPRVDGAARTMGAGRSEEPTSELQSL